MNSILDTIKTSLGIPIDDIAFDTDILMHINTEIMTLEQLGVSLNSDFRVTGESETWDQLFNGITKNVEAAKSYIYIKVKLVFDPPSSSFVIEALNKAALEQAWRLAAQMEIS